MATARTGGKAEASVDPEARRPACTPAAAARAGGEEGREDAVGDRGITLVLGGASSGKSEVAERIAAAAGGPVTYVATGPVPGIAAAKDVPTTPGADDERARADWQADWEADWEARVARHRARRPPHWRTVELPQGGDLGAALRAVAGVALVDSLGTWLAGLPGFGEEEGLSRLADALRWREAAGLATVVVSEEVGLGVHPATTAGIAFREAMGRLNGRIGELAGDVLLVVAGRVLPLPRFDRFADPGAP